MDLTYHNAGHAPGYRDLCVEVKDEKGNIRELRLTPKDVQRLIYAVHDPVRSGEREPLDWEVYPQPFYWPPVSSQWKPLPQKQDEATKARASDEFPKPLCDFILYHADGVELSRALMVGRSGEDIMEAKRQWDEYRFREHKKRKENRK